MARLSVEAIDFARTHARAFWDSDFFPKAFEFKALLASWQDVVKYLTSDDVENLPIRPARLAVVPKPNASYRVVHQLDPLNALTYTGLAAMIAPSIEAARIPVEERVACSYRIELEPSNGNFFREGSGWPDFIEQSRALSEGLPCVLVTDIIDYYNQVYLHRLQNAISFATGDNEELANAVEEFLMSVNNRISRGIPVGPAASIVMAEAVLMDVDTFIRGHGFQHTRYVDDFNIFGSSRDELHAFLRDLILYLHSNHRLTLSSGKTEVLTAAEFQARFLDDSAEIERAEIHRALEDIQPIPRYEFLGADDPVQPVENVDVQARSAALRDLMERICARPELDLGLARHVLRRCRRYRLRAIVPQLLDNFDFFAPAMTDVALYLDAVTSDALVPRIEGRLYDICVGSNAMKIPWVREWMFKYITGQARLVRQERFQLHIRQHGDFIARARLALALRDVAWVREHRDRLDTLGAWERRWLIRCAAVLARDERRAWLNNIAANTTDRLERWVARWVAR